MRQPFLHDLVVALAAPVQAWSHRDGAMADDGLCGVYVGDHRVLTGVSVELSNADGPVELALLTADTPGGGRVSFVSVARIAAAGSDPVLTLTRTRTATASGVVEELTLASALETPLALDLRVSFVPDATPFSLIRAGLRRTDALARDGLRWNRGEGTRAELNLPDADVADTDGVVRADWRLTVPARGSATASWQLDAFDDAGPFVACTAPPLRTPSLVGAPPALERLVARSVADLNALRLAERADPERFFVAAGAPWYLTLFGRDSLLTARLFLAADPTLAVATLRTLAARQGRVVDADRAEAPGKILHEVRAEALDLTGGIVLPPEYYGTIDATALWICLLGQAWRAGVDDATIASFMDPLLAALVWLDEHADADGDGFVEYYDESGHGLANQGWKDSPDSVRFADGTIAEGPIALAEVQGYAYAAARTASELLARFGRDEGERSRGEALTAWADDLARRFRERFWVSDADGPYPALALDRNKRPVTGVASNMGHLLATGILDAGEERLVVRRLMDPRMFSGFGVRTLSSDNGGYWPLSYHVGSVWTHDTAMIIEGLLARGFDAEARRLAEGLLRASEGFGDQLPELFGGQPSDELFPPAAYPAACHPQAWAAASAITIAKALSTLP